LSISSISVCKQALISAFALTSRYASTIMPLQTRPSRFSTISPSRSTMHPPPLMPSILEPARRISLNIIHCPCLTQRTEATQAAVVTLY
jgi:hypothetical protein